MALEAPSYIWYSEVEVLCLSQYVIRYVPCVREDESSVVFSLDFQPKSDEFRGFMGRYFFELLLYIQESRLSDIFRGETSLPVVAA